MCGDATLFFLRCVFWLAIVYASMSWTRQDLAPGDWTSAPASPGALAGDLAGRAMAGAAALCQHKPARCLAEAARLTALVDSTAPDAARDTADVASRATPPLPIPDPRRHARTAMQTQPR